MVNRDGNGWATCGLGHRHWGRHGAAGLLLFAPAGDAPAGDAPAGDAPAADGGAGEPTVLLQRRSVWVNHGGTWGPPGGARDSHESAVAAALREAAEECAVPAGQIRVTGIHDEDHGGWRYQTVIAAAPAQPPVRPASGETSEVRWLPAADVGGLDLHPAFAAQWPVLRACLRPLTVIVDVANVMGARADGWWRDRAGAARRLIDELTPVAGRGVRGLPPDLRLPDLEPWCPEFAAVIEGQARAMTIPERLAQGTAERIRVVSAPGSGDDTIVSLAGQLAGRRLVVTADRELRARCLAAGASVTGPRWLLGLLP